MEAIYLNLTTRILSKASERNGERYIVAIAGGPGSGKTTIATEVVRRINALQMQKQEQPRSAVCVSMDGFHLPRSCLDTLPNQEEAYIRRGAPWTFDVDRIVKFVQNLRRWADLTSLPSSSHADMRSTDTCCAEELPKDHFSAPTFSHSLKDPVPNSLLIPPSATIIILEGNYLLLDQPQWREISPLIDFRVFICVDPEIMRKRVARRHVKAGIEPNLECGFRRVDRNDAINARMVEGMIVRSVDMVVESVEERPGGESGMDSMR